jgi:hypothetical protein
MAVPQRVALDKSEGGVKDKVILGGAMSTAFLPERLRTKTLQKLRYFALSQLLPELRFEDKADNLIVAGHAFALYLSTRSR